MDYLQTLWDPAISIRYVTFKYDIEVDMWGYQWILKDLEMESIEDLMIHKPVNIMDYKVKQFENMDFRWSRLSGEIMI